MYFNIYDIECFKMDVASCLLLWKGHKLFYSHGLV